MYFTYLIGRSTLAKNCVTHTWSLAMWRSSEVQGVKQQFFLSVKQQLPGLSWRTKIFLDLKYELCLQGNLHWKDVFSKAIVIPLKRGFVSYNLPSSRGGRILCPTDPISKMAQQLDNISSKTALILQGACFTPLNFYYVNPLIFYSPVFSLGELSPFKVRTKAWELGSRLHNPVFEPLRERKMSWVLSQLARVVLNAFTN